MALILTTNDILKTDLISYGDNYFDKSSWVGTLVENTVITAKLLPSTKYYIHYTVKKIADPVSHFYTTQSWAQTNLYNNSTTVNCLGLSKAQ